MNLLRISLDVAGKALECVNKWMPGQFVDVVASRDFDAAGRGAAYEYEIATVWLGWAVPAIKTELTAHQVFHWTDDSVGVGAEWECECNTPIDSYETWVDHISPLIAERIGCDPKRAADALSRYKPDRVSL